MNVERYNWHTGRKDITHGISAQAADDIYQSLLYQVRTPGERYYRVTLVDPLAGGRIVRDTDHEVFGRSTITPRANYNTLRSV